MHHTHTRAMGLALLFGGLLTAGINIVLTPMLPDTGLAATAAEPVFALRQGLSAAAAALLMFGAVGVHIAQMHKVSLFGTLALLAALVGSGMLLAVEWGQVFLVRDLAARAPAALDALDAGGTGPGLYDIGSMAAFGAFALGWVLLGASALTAGVLPRLGPILLLVGLFATPIAGGLLPRPWGFVAGNAVLGAGWVLMGWALTLRR